MTHRLITHTAAAAMLFAGTASPLLAAQSPDCTAPEPSIETPDATAQQQPEAAPDGTELTLSQRLATCGSVLDPPALGDPDIVEPAPRIGDPMNINPRAPDEIRPQVK